MVDSHEVLLMHERHTGVLDIKADFDISTKSQLSEAYTPGVAELAEIIAKDEEAKDRYTMSGKLVCVITDGSAVLGLGNIGPSAGLPIVEGKALIYKDFAGIDAIPMALDQVSADEEVATIKNIAKSFAGIHLEDIAAPGCFEIEEKLKAQLGIPVYHDDQTGTAIVVLAALMNAAKVVGKDVKELKVLLNGLGASGLATAKLLYACGMHNLTLVDVKGKITADNDFYNSYQRDFAAQLHQPDGTSLDELIAGQDAFIGLSVGNVLKQDEVAKMADDPIIFALANPTPEIDPDVAKKAGAAVVATGSSQYPNQVNNVLVFPGLFNGLIENHVKSVETDLQVKVAQRLADLSAPLSSEHVIAGVFDKGVVDSIAAAVKEYAQQNLK
jgi:malate dehydrogenase (oxaloacetate-decarboxylating)